jgi:hypothetical protein
MKTVIITHGFEVDGAKGTDRHEAGDEVDIADAIAEQWLAKGLARLKPGPKPESKPAEPKPAPKSAD